MPKIVLPQKSPSDTIQIEFDFASYLPSGVTISSAVTTATVYSGTDSSPSSVISGSASVGTPANYVTQSLTSGVVGVTYLISCAATLTNSNVVTLTGFLPVIAVS